MLGAMTVCDLATAVHGPFPPSSPECHGVARSFVCFDLNQDRLRLNPL
jgi:hypothetical protein